MTASWDSKTSKKQIELKENLAKIQKSSLYHNRVFTEM
jgi:hypothetical protein